MSADFKSHMVFVRPRVVPGEKKKRVSVDAKIYQQILSKHALSLLKREKLTLQQDGATPHTAMSTMSFLDSHGIKIIAPKEWPANSPDLNPMDYTIWGNMVEKVYARPVRTLGALEARIRRAWYGLDQEYIRNSIGQWEGRLNKCIDVSGSYFEHLKQ